MNLLSPKKVKYRKVQKGYAYGTSRRAAKLSFGDFGLQVLNAHRLTAVQIESVRVFLVRKLKKQGKFWLRVFPDIPVTAKPTEVRMGRGKGEIEYWMCRVKGNRIIVEIANVTKSKAYNILQGVAYKLPFKKYNIVQR